MKEFGHIYLSWRQGFGHRRFIVGIIKRSSIGGVSFEYIKHNVANAIQSGFVPYTEFPDTEKIYTENVIEVFGTRLVKSEREDAQEFYDFWEIDPKYKDDKLALLAHTQGISATDNFEFLADYHPIEDLKFLTDLAGVSHLKLKAEELSMGDVLRFEKETSNKFDYKAIKVFKGAKHVCYIKKVHVNVFHGKNGNKLKLSVKALDKNGIIKRVFVKVSF